MSDDVPRLQLEGRAMYRRASRGTTATVALTPGVTGAARYAETRPAAGRRRLRLRVPSLHKHS